MNTIFKFRSFCLWSDLKYFTVYRKYTLIRCGKKGLKRKSIPEILIPMGRYFLDYGSAPKHSEHLLRLVSHLKRRGSQLYCWTSCTTSFKKASTISPFLFMKISIDTLIDTIIDTINIGASNPLYSLHTTDSGSRLECEDHDWVYKNRKTFNQLYEESLLWTLYHLPSTERGRYS